MHRRRGLLLAGAVLCVALLGILATGCASEHSIPDATLGPEIKGELSDAMSEASSWGERWEAQRCDQDLVPLSPVCEERLLEGGDVAEEIHALFDGLRHHAVETNETREIARVAGLAAMRVDRWVALGCADGHATDCDQAALDAAEMLVALAEAGVYYSDPSEW